MLSSAIILTLLCLQLAPPIQGSSSLFSGTQFVTAFFEHPQAGYQFELILNGIECCASVNVTIKSINFFQNYIIQQGKMVSITLPGSAMITDSSFSSSKVVVISSNSSISVISKVWGDLGYDWSYVYPVNLPDVQYYVITPISDFPTNVQFAILSLEEVTSVTMTLSDCSLTCQGQSLSSGDSTGFKLSPYQSAQFHVLGGDLSGSFIEANKAIAVLVFQQMTNTYSVRPFSYIFEQIPPITRWGKSFVLPPMSISTSMVNKILVMASQDTNVKVYDESAEVASTSLSRGTFFAQMATNALWIESDQDVMIMFVCYGINNNGVAIYPFMSNVMATTMFETSQVVYAHYSFMTNIFVFTNNKEMSGIVVDGISLSSTIIWNSIALGSMDLSWMEVTISQGSHYVQQLQNANVWAMFYTFDGRTNAHPYAGNKANSFNFYGEGLECDCQGPLQVSTTPSQITTPTTSQPEMTTPTTSLPKTTTPTTSLPKTTTPTTSLPKTTTPTTSLPKTTTPTTSLPKTTTPTTSLPKTTTPTIAVFNRQTTNSCSDDLGEVFIITTPLGWWDALRYCRKYYTDLYSVQDNCTQSLLVTTMKNCGVLGSEAWIGLRRHKFWGYLYWTDKQPTDYMNWGDGEPSDPLFNLCTSISPDKNFTWNDQCCAMELNFICY